MKTLITLLAATAILATPAAAQTRRTKEVRIQHNNNNNSLARKSASRNPVNLIKAAHCHFHHGEADPDPQVRLYMTRDCKEHEEAED